MQGVWKTRNARNRKWNYVNVIMESIWQPHCEMKIGLGESYSNSTTGSIIAWMSVHDRFKIISERYAAFHSSTAFNKQPFSPT